MFVIENLSCLRKHVQGAGATSSATTEEGHPGGKTAKVVQGKGPAGVHSEADTTQTRAGSKYEVKREKKTDITRKSSSRTSTQTYRGGHCRGESVKTSKGVRRETMSPSREPSAISSWSAEIRGLFERAGEVEFTSTSQQHSDESHMSSTIEVEEEEHTLKTQARQLEVGRVQTCTLFTTIAFYFCSRRSPRVQI